MNSSAIATPATTRLSAVQAGTHRVVPPHETWARLEPLLPAAGITRVADVTQLDDIGVPVWQAIRPNSANLAVSQGKGISHELARVSAAMESFELFCAESPQLPVRSARVAELADGLPYRWSDLVLLDHHVMGPWSHLQWWPAEDLHTGRDTWVPLDAVSVDLRMRSRWAPPTVHTSSNGLAGGNSMTEATVHGLLEVMERHAMARFLVQGRIWDAAVRTVPGAHGAARTVVERCLDAEAVVEVTDVTCELGVPSFAARIWSPSVPWWFSGSGAHLDADIALSRAVTEAVQSRLTVVTGAREDLPDVPYNFSARPPAPPQPRRAAGSDAREGSRVRSTDDLLAPHCAPMAKSRDLEAELAHLLDVADRHGTAVMRADLTHPSFGVPVVHVLTPGLRFTPKAWS
ncbi:YcaO-like family protein [Streptomyces roseus]|uniref:YcaO-like family protein n=1 Tax=Streptomyces roseus TaxID=66430 RepID=UPI003682010D